MEDAAIRVLIIEDDLDYAEVLRLCLEEPESMGLSFTLDHAVRLSEGLTKLTTSRYDAVLVDLGLPDASGLDAALAVLQAAPDTPVLVSTNQGDEAAALEAMRLGAQDFMIKASTDSRMLKRSIRYAIERKTALAQRDLIIRASADGMVVVDASGVARFANAAAERILGTPSARLLGRPFPYAARSGATSMLSVPRPDGTSASVEMRATELLWDSAPAVLASLRDVTELRRVENLKAEVAHRRKMDELKDKWMETLSHELRTPLTIIKGAVVDLDEGQSGPLPEPQAMLVGLARRQIERIERMVLDLLDLSRLESGRAKMERKAFDAAEAVRRTAGDFSRAAAERAIAIAVECEPRSQPITADPDLFEQLAVNLIENAIRFARSRILVRLRAVEGGLVEFSVEDDGVGIPPEKKELLFTRFNQLERKGTPGYKGTGLGLAICKEIASLHAGTIRVDSEQGRGTSFVVHMPASGATASGGRAAQRAGGVP